jgi:hypothetical protein
MARAGQAASSGHAPATRANASAISFGAPGSDVVFATSSILYKRVAAAAVAAALFIGAMTARICAPWDYVSTSSPGCASLGSASPVAHGPADEDAANGRGEVGTMSKVSTRRRWRRAWPNYGY